MSECPHCRQPVSDAASYCENCGAPLTADGSPPTGLTRQIRELLAADKKIEAIRVLREATGVDLAEAKRLVEAEADVIAALPVGSPDDDFDRELLGLVRAGRKIEAIKRHRERTHFGLKESKDFVEALAARHGIAPARTGCAGVLVLGLMLVVGAAISARGGSDGCSTTLVRGQAPQNSELAEMCVDSTNGAFPPVLSSAVPDPLPRNCCSAPGDDDECHRMSGCESNAPEFTRTLPHDASGPGDQPAAPPAKKSDEGWFVHRVMSESQAGPTEIKVLLPDRMEAGKRHAVLYVLPVEANHEHRYGDGLTEVKRCDIHNKHNLICVAPTFAHLPWYADHPTDKSIRQESYFVKEVVPLVERLYPARTDRDGRWLLGFSKSGWGAWSLLARHPNLFGRAAAWDAPIDMPRFDQYGAGQVFGTQEHFETYRLLPALKKCTSLIESPPRLVLTGYDNFRDQHETAHRQLDEWKIPHVYRDGPQRKHVWNSGWVEEAVDLLAGLKP